MCLSSSSPAQLTSPCCNAAVAFAPVQVWSKQGPAHPSCVTCSQQQCSQCWHRCTRGRSCLTPRQQRQQLRQQPWRASLQAAPAAAAHTAAAAAGQRSACWWPACRALAVIPLRPRLPVLLQLSRAQQQHQLGQGRTTPVAVAQAAAAAARRGLAARLQRQPCGSAYRTHGTTCVPVRLGAPASSCMHRGLRAWQGCSSTCCSCWVALGRPWLRGLAGWLSSSSRKSRRCWQGQAPPHQQQQAPAQPRRPLGQQLQQQQQGLSWDCLVELAVPWGCLLQWAGLFGALHVTSAHNSSSRCGC